MNIIARQNGDLDDNIEKIIGEYYLRKSDAVGEFFDI